MITTKTLFMMIMVISLALSACTREATVLPHTTIDDLGMQGIVVSPDTDENNLLQQFGTPLERTEDDIYNHNRDDYLDSYIRYIYPEFEVHYYQCNLESNK